MSELRSCAGCKHYDPAYYDSDTGDSQEDYCGVTTQLCNSGDCTEPVANVLQAVLFQLSVLNNCPLRQDERRSLLHLKGKT